MQLTKINKNDLSRILHLKFKDVVTNDDWDSLAEYLFDIVKYNKYNHSTDAEFIYVPAYVKLIDLPDNPQINLNKDAMVNLKNALVEWMTRGNMGHTNKGE